MIITGSDYGEIILGRVIKTKRGSGQAENRLTIVTLENVSDPDPSHRELKLLFWNSKKENGPMLAERARKLKPGTFISARGIRDKGDRNKFTAFELKYRGMYKLVQNAKYISYVLTGRVAKLTYSNGCTSAYIPVDMMSSGTIWYRLNLYGELSVSDILKGDIIIAKASKMKEKMVNGITFRDLTATMLQTFH